jgi:hypothetical protein
MSRYIQAIVEDETHRNLKIVAFTKDMTLSVLVKTIVESYLAKEETKSSQGEQGKRRKATGN